MVASWDEILPGVFTDCGIPDHPSFKHKHYIFKEGEIHMDPTALLISYILKQVTEYPEDVSINQSVDERGILLKVSVNPADLGRVIGAKGQTAQALRTLLRAMGNKYNAKYNLKIMEDNE